MMRTDKNINIDNGMPKTESNPGLSGNGMDREITADWTKKRRMRRLLRIVLPIAAVVVLGVGVLLFTEKSVKESDLRLCVADRGPVATTVEATGSVVPAFEQTVVSPVATKIMEVYRQEGDSVSAGEALLRLDLQSAETEMRNQADELSMRKNSTRQTQLDSRTFLTNLEMKIKAKEMAVSELRAEVANERRLDSLGSGTGDRVRQAELAYKTGRLELEQMRKELANERQSHSAAYMTRKLEENIASKNLGALRRTLEDAQVKAPRTATLTYINSSIGASIAPGDRLAVLSDLSSFKISAQVPEGSASKVSPGAQVEVRAAGMKLSGTVTRVVPQSANGLVSFTVKLDNPEAAGLRPGLRTMVSVVYDVLPDVTRIKNGSYYKGPGTYEMFVDTGDGHLEKRRLQLGESNYDFVEVKSGLKPGERVAIGDMEDYGKNRRLKIKR